MAETSKNSAGEIAVDITGNTDPLKKKLAEMKSESEAAAKRVEQKPTSGVSGGIKDAAQESDKLGIKFAQLKVGMLAIAGAAKQLWDGIKGARAAGEDFGKTMRNIEAAFRSDIIASLDPITQRREEILRTAKDQKDALEAEIRNRGILEDFIASLYNDPEAEARRRKIEEETKAALRRLDQSVIDGNKKKLEEVKRQNEEARAALLDGEDKDRAEMRIKAAAIMKSIREAESKDIADQYRESLQLLYAGYNAKRDAARETSKKIAADEEARTRELVDREEEIRRRASNRASEEMRAQFANLRNDINGLFNTSGLEVGINRIGALIETLIQKTGDSR